MSDETNEIPDVIENTLVGPYEKIFDFGPQRLVTLADFYPKNAPEVLKKEFADYLGLIDLIKERFETEDGRQDEIVFALNEAVMNFAEHKNGMTLERLEYLARHPEEISTEKRVRVWPWRSKAHLCFVVNGDGPPNYDFDPTTVPTVSLDKEGKMLFKKRGRGHSMIIPYSNFVLYDHLKGMVMYFNLPEKYWI